MSQTIQTVQYNYKDNFFVETSPDEVSTQIYSILQNFQVIKTNQQNEIEQLKATISQGSNYLSKLKLNQSRFVNKLAFQITKLLSQKVLPHQNIKIQQYISQNYYTDVQETIKRVHQNYIQIAQTETNLLKEHLKQKIQKLEAMVKQQKKDEYQMRNLISKLQEFSKQNIIQIPVQMQVPREIYEIPIEMELQVERQVYEVPIEMQIMRQVCQSSVQTDDVESEIKIVEVPVQLKIFQSQIYSKNLLNESEIKQIDEHIQFYKSGNQQLVNISKNQQIRSQRVIQVPIILQKIIQVPNQVIIEKLVEIPTFISQVQEVVEKKVKRKIKKQSQPKISRLIYDRHNSSSWNSFTEGLIDNRYSETHYGRVPASDEQEYQQIQQTIYQSRMVDMKDLCSGCRNIEKTTMDRNKQKTIIEVPIVDQRIVERIVQVPVIMRLQTEIPIIQERIIERIIQVPVIIQKIVQIEVPVQISLEQKQKILEIPITIQKIVEVPVIVQKIVEVPVQMQTIKYVQVPIIQQKIVEKIVQVPVQTITQKFIEIPVEIQALSNVNHFIQVPIIEQPTQKIVQVPLTIEKIKNIQIPVEIRDIQTQIKYVQVPVIVQRIVQKIVEVPVIVEKVTIVEVPVEIQRLETLQNVVETPIIIEKVVEKIVEKIVDVPVIVEKIRIVEVPVEIQRVQSLNKVIETPLIEERIVERIVEVPVIVEKIKIVQVPVEIQKVNSFQRVLQIPIVQEKLVDKLVQVPVVVQKTKIIQVPIEIVDLNSASKVAEIPLIQEKIVQKMVQVPLIVQRNKIIEVPVEIQRIVQIEKIIQVPLQVILDRENIDGHIEIENLNNSNQQQNQTLNKIEISQRRIVEIPVQIIVQPQLVRQIQQVPCQIIIEKIVEVPVIIQKIVQVPVIIQKLIQVPIIVQKTVQVPVVIQTTKQVQIPVEVQAIHFGQNQRILTSNQQNRDYVHIQNQDPNIAILKDSLLDHLTFEQQCQVIQVPVQVFIERQVIIQKIVEVPIIIQTVKHIEVPVQIQKIVYIDRIVEVPIQQKVQTQNVQHLHSVNSQIVEVPVQIFLVKTIQIPCEIIIQKQVYVQKIVVVKQFIQVPVEVIIYKQIIVEKPVIIRQIVEVPCQIIVQSSQNSSSQRIVQVPILIQKEKLIEIPVQIQTLNSRSISTVQVPVIIQEDMTKGDQAEYIQGQTLQNSAQDQVFVLNNRVDSKRDIQIIQVPVQIIVYKQVIVREQVIVQKIVEVPVIVQKIKIVQVPIQIQRVSNLNSAVQTPIIEQRVVQVPIIIEKIKIIEIPVEIQPVNQPTNNIEIPIIQERVIQKIVQKIVEVPVIVEKVTIVEVPVEIQRLETLQNVVETPIIIEKVVEKIVEVPVIVEKIRIVEVPVELQRVDSQKLQIVQIPMIVQNSAESHQLQTVEPSQVHQQYPNEEQTDENLISLQNKAPSQILSNQQIQVVQVPVEVIVEREVIVEKLIERIVEKVVEKIVEVPVIVEKIRIVEVPVEIQRVQSFNKVIETPIVQQKLVQKIVQVPVIVQRDRIIQVPVQLEKASDSERIQVTPLVEQRIVREIVEVPTQIIVTSYIQAPCEVIVEVQKIVQKPVLITQIVEVPVQVIVKQYIQVPVEIIIQKIIEVPVYIKQIVEIPQQIIIEKEIVIEKSIIVQKPVIIKQIVQVPVQIMVQVPLSNQQQKIKYVQIPVQIENTIYKQIQIPIILQQNSIKQLQRTRGSGQKVNHHQFSNPLSQTNLMNASSTQNIMTSEQQLSQQIYKLQSSNQVINQSINERIGLNQNFVQQINQNYAKQTSQDDHIAFNSGRNIEIVQIPVQIIRQKYIEVPVIIEKQKIVQLVVVEERLVEVPVILQKIIQKIVQIPLIVNQRSQNNHQSTIYNLDSCQTLYPHIQSHLEKLQQQQKVLLLAKLRQTYSEFFRQEKQFYQIPVQLVVQQEAKQKLIYQIPVQMTIVPQQQEHLLLQNSTENSPQIQYIPRRNDRINRIQQIMILQGDSITHGNCEQLVQIQQNLQGSLPAGQISEPNIEINQIIIGRRTNIDSSIQSSDNRIEQFHKLKNLNVSAIKKQANQQRQQNNLFGSQNQIKQDVYLSGNYGLGKIQINHNDNSSFDCGEHTQNHIGKNMQIDHSNNNLLTPHRNINGMPVLLQNTEQISRTHSNISGMKERNLGDQEQLEQLQKLKSDIHYLHEDNQVHKKQLQQISAKNKLLISQLQNKNIQINNLNSQVLTYSLQKENELQLFKSQRNEIDGFVDKIRQQNQQLTKQIKEILIKYQKLQTKYENYKSQNNQLKNKLTTEIQILTNQIYEKRHLLQQVKAEQSQTKNFYQQQLFTISEGLKSHQVQINKLQQEISKRDDIIERLTYSHQQLRKKLCLSLDGSLPSSSTTEIYQQQFQRIKQQFQDQVQQKSEKLIELTLIIQSLEQKLQRQRQVNKKLSQQRLEAQKNYQRILTTNQKEKTQYQFKLYELQTKLNELLLSVQQENYLLKQKNDEKSIIIQKLRSSQKMNNLGKNAEKDTQLQATYNKKEISAMSAAVKIEHISQQKQRDQLRRDSFYIQKLESMILRYEKTIEGSQQMIEQLQQRVYQYLRDALQKEQQAQALYTKLCQYENTINSILVEKITMQLQNKRLKKVINQSQKKLQLLGNQLIKVARQSIEYRGDEDEDDQFEDEEEEEEQYC